MDRLNQLLNLNNDTPNEPFILFAIAQEYLKTSAFQESLIFFDKLIATSPNYVGAYYHLGFLHEKMNKQNLAIKTYKIGIEVAEKNQASHDLEELKTALNLLLNETDES